MSAFIFFIINGICHAGEKEMAQNEKIRDPLSIATESTAPEQNKKLYLLFA